MRESFVEIVGHVYSIHANFKLLTPLAATIALHVLNKAAATHHVPWKHLRQESKFFLAADISRHKPKRQRRSREHVANSSDAEEFTSFLRC